MEKILTEPILLLPSVYTFEVPMDASNIQLYCTGGIVDEIRWNIVKPAGKGIKITTTNRHLKPGNWSIICCSATATEEEAAKVVESRRMKEIDKLYDKLYYKDYTPKNLKYWCGKATESLASLLRSKGCDPSLNWLILKSKSSETMGK